VSVTIEPGEKLAIVGPTGSGKSTMIRLLGRFYDFPRDMILLDDVDLNDLHSRDIRRRIGVVLQDFHIFSGSILDNIVLGNPEITRERAIEAAKTVNAHGFITELPMGYETPLVERGSNLSQGQRQLLAFARVLAADPEILVLDEATASIDTETELLIQDGLRKLMKDRTSVLIAHRLQTIQEADKVLVLHHGVVKEVGSHEELLAQKGLYHTLHELQFQDVSIDDEGYPAETD
jgi:ABC-type multidrug transport system fused ATPase/permease subunit